MRLDKISGLKLIELVSLMMVINLAFASMYYQIYKRNPRSFINALHEDESISFFDFFYFSNTIFFSLGYDVVPRSGAAKTLCISHMIVSFLALTIMLSNLME
jgi:uncharacterized membrane protein